MLVSSSEELGVVWEVVSAAVVWAEDVVSTDVAPWVVSTVVSKAVVVSPAELVSSAVE